MRSTSDFSNMAGSLRVWVSKKCDIEVLSPLISKVIETIVDGLARCHERGEIPGNKALPRIGDAGREP